MQSTLFDRVFRDDQGKVVLGQMPNLPIMVWAGASLLKIIFTKGTINTGLDIVALVSLVIWAGAELFQGVNYFRRALGLFVLIGLFISRIQ